MYMGAVTTPTDTANAVRTLFAVMGSAPKTPPALAANLDEVKVTVKPISTSVPTPPADDMPEIVVSAPRIQWWQWLLAGGAAVFILNELRG